MRLTWFVAWILSFCHRIWLGVLDLSGRPTHRPRTALLFIPGFGREVSCEVNCENRECSEGDVNAKATENILLHGERKKWRRQCRTYGPSNRRGCLSKSICRSKGTRIRSGRVNENKDNPWWCKVRFSKKWKLGILAYRKPDPWGSTASLKNLTKTRHRMMIDPIPVQGNWWPETSKILE